jgi:LPXTG-site transpeptidase (sortase) family protein
MRQTRLIVIFAALLLGACGGAQQAAQPTAQPTAPPTAAPAPTAVPPTAAPTESSLISESSVPAPSPTLAGAMAATDPPLPTEPTARLILPAPTTSSAPQAAVPTPAPSAKVSEPTRLVIDAINLDGKLLSVGLDKDRIPVVPKHNVGWYNLSARPGEGDNIVLWGHVLRFRDSPNAPAPFAHLKEVQPGAAVVLYDKAGKAHRYVVTKQVWVTPDQVEYILPQGKEMVTMVSCIGDKIIQGNEVVDESHRLITIAEPAS